MPRVYLSASTQESNIGITPFTTEEKEMNLIVDKLMPILYNDGRFIPKRNLIYMDPYQSADDSNTFLAELHIAIHSNAGGGQGTEVFTFGPNTSSEKLGKALYNQIAPLSPGNDRGVKHNPGLIEVGNTVHATSCLIELDFHDNPAGAKWIAENHLSIAQALYRGVCDYYGYKYLALDTSPVTPPPTPSPDTLDHDVNLVVWCPASKAQDAIKSINSLGFYVEQFPLKLRRD